MQLFEGVKNIMSKTPKKSAVEQVRDWRELPSGMVHIFDRSQVERVYVVKEGGVKQTCLEAYREAIARVEANGGWFLFRNDIVLVNAPSGRQLSASATWWGWQADAGIWEFLTPAQRAEAEEYAHKLRQVAIEFPEVAEALRMGKRK